MKNALHFYNTFKIIHIYFYKYWILELTCFYLWNGGAYKSTIATFFFL